MKRLNKIAFSLAVTLGVVATVATVHAQQSQMGPGAGMGLGMGAGMHGEMGHGMMGGQMLVSPTLPAGQSIYFIYLHKNCVALASGGYGDSFLADGDSFVLGDRLLKLGMIWQWKANKGAGQAQTKA